MVQQDGVGLLHHLKHHDATQVSAHWHGHVGEGRKLVQELQQLLYFMPEDRDVRKLLYTIYNIVYNLTTKKMHLFSNFTTLFPIISFS